MASSAVSVVSTSSSYFSRIRDKNMRADFESSTINAPLPLIPAPDDKSSEDRPSVAQNIRAPSAPGHRREDSRLSPDYDAESVKTGWVFSQRRARVACATGVIDRYRSKSRRAMASDDHSRGWGLPAGGGAGR